MALVNPLGPFELALDPMRNRISQGYAYGDASPSIIGAIDMTARYRAVSVAAALDGVG